MQDRSNGVERPSHSSDIIAIQEACLILGVHRNTLYRLIQDESLPAFKMTAGGKWRFRRSDLVQWIEDKQGRRRL